MITFISGVMNSGKSARLIEEIDRRQKYPHIILKPAQDTRDGEYVKTRKHIRKHRGILVDDSNYMLRQVIFGSIQYYDTVFIDEVQFFSKDFIELLLWHCKQWNTDIIASGLRKNFKGEFFPASALLLAASHKQEFHEGECFACSSKDGQVVVMMDALNNLILEGDTVQTEETLKKNHYETLCYNCYEKFLKESDDEKSKIKISNDPLTKWLLGITD